MAFGIAVALAVAVAVTVAVVVPVGFIVFLLFFRVVCMISGCLFEFVLAMFEKGPTCVSYTFLPVETHVGLFSHGLVP